MRGGLEGVLAAHNGVKLTAGWPGSPDSGDPQNIKRVCKCGEVIAWHDRSRRDRSGPHPLAGYPHDEPHRTHVAAAIREWLTSEAVVEAAASALFDAGNTAEARDALTAAVNADTEGDDL